MCVCVRACARVCMRTCVCVHTYMHNHTIHILYAVNSKLHYVYMCSEESAL